MTPCGRQDDYAALEVHRQELVEGAKLRMAGLLTSTDAQAVLSALSEYSNMRIEAGAAYNALQGRAMEMVDAVRRDMRQYLLEVEPSTTHPADVLQKLSVCDLFGQVSAAACLHGLKVWFSM